MAIKKKVSKVEVVGEIVEKYMTDETDERRPKEVIELIMKTTKMGKAGATTYYYNARRKILEDES